MAFILGFDVAQKKDYSALCAVEQSVRGNEGHYFIHQIERLPHGLRYNEQIDHVRKRQNQATVLAGATMAIDQTGVGAAVVDMFRMAGLPVLLRPILITSGSKATWNEEDRCYHVPKRELVGVLSVLLETQRLKMAAGLQFEATLKAELQNFSAKITPAGNQTFEAWREGQHDDLVLSVALALWLGEHFPVGWDGSIPTGKSVFSDMPVGVALPEQQEEQEDRRKQFGGGAEGMDYGSSGFGGKFPHF